MFNREALEYLATLGNTDVVEVNGQQYATEKLHLIQQPTPATLVVRNLSGLVDYLKSDFDAQFPLLVHVASPTDVIAVSNYNNDYTRKHIVEAKALVPEFRFGNFYDAEDFNIKLQAGFVDLEDRATVLRVVGNIKEEAVKTVGDDGVSQSVVAKNGVASVENVKVPNPVNLAPYRTFVEVDQPASRFVFRMQSGPRAALFEADGGAWKNAAIGNIAAYLREQLKDLIESDSIIIIA